MRISADTNLLVRLFMRDDIGQADRARAEIAGASLVAIGNVALAELVWVLTRGYGQPKAIVAGFVRELAGSSNVAVDHEAVEAGCRMLDRGGDFADAVIALEGSRLGGAELVSFDGRALRRFADLSRRAREPA